MQFPKIEINDDVIISLSKKYHIKELAFFGSVLREDFNENSDIDILIEFIDINEYSLFDIFKMKADFEMVFGKSVDSLPFGLSALQAKTQHHLPSSRLA